MLARFQTLCCAVMMQACYAPEHLGSSKVMDVSPCHDVLTSDILAGEESTRVVADDGRARRELQLETLHDEIVTMDLARNKRKRTTLIQEETSLLPSKSETEKKAGANKRRTKSSLTQKSPGRNEHANVGDRVRLTGMRHSRHSRVHHPSAAEMRLAEIRRKKQPFSEAHNTIEKDSIFRSDKIRKNNPLDSNNSASATTSWAQNFIESCPSDTLLPIPRDFLEDGFNLVHIASIVARQLHNETTDGKKSLYKSGLRLILDKELQAEEEQVQSAAKIIYTLVHARYVTSPRGLDTVRKMMMKHPMFGRCSRVKCRGMPLLPCGRSDKYNDGSRAMRYCCSCGEQFYLWHSKVDGSAWGTSFCHLFLLTHGREVFPQLLSEGSSETRSKDEQEDPVPKIFGFRLHPCAKTRYPLLKIHRDSSDMS